MSEENTSGFVEKAIIGSVVSLAVLGPGGVFRFMAVGFLYMLLALYEVDLAEGVANPNYGWLYFACVIWLVAAFIWGNVAEPLVAGFFLMVNEAFWYRGHPGPNLYPDVNNFSPEVNPIASWLTWGVMPHEGGDVPLVAVVFIFIFYSVIFRIAYIVFLDMWDLRARQAPMIREVREIEGQMRSQQSGSGLSLPPATLDKYKDKWNL